IEGIVRAIQFDGSPTAIFNLGSTEEVTILELAHLVKEACDTSNELKIRLVPYTSFGGNYEDVRRRVPDVSHARELLGFEAQVRLRDGLRPTVAWQRKILGFE